MASAYSTDLRIRVIDTVEAGSSRREAAERFDISVSSAVRWLQRWHEAGRAEAKPRGGSCSPLEEHADSLLALIKEQPDLTLEEVVATMRKQRIACSRTAVWRFFVRHGISFKKNAVRKRANPGWPAHADAGSGNSACLIRRRWCFSMRPPSAPIW